MLKKITDLWPNLVRIIKTDDDSENERLLSQVSAEGADEDDSQKIEDKGQVILFDEDQLKIDFKNIYWT